MQLKLYYFFINVAKTDGLRIIKCETKHWILKNMNECTVKHSYERCSIESMGVQAHCSSFQTHFVKHLDLFPNVFSFPVCLQCPSRSHTSTVSYAYLNCILCIIQTCRQAAARFDLHFLGWCKVEWMPAAAQLQQIHFSFCAFQERQMSNLTS